MLKKVKLTTLAAGIGLMALVAMTTTACYHGGDVPEDQINTVSTVQSEENTESAIHPSGNENIVEPESTQVSNTNIDQVQNQTINPQQPAQQVDPNQQLYYEDVTVAAGDVYAPQVRATDVAEEYRPAQVECQHSPNGYHSWSSVYEWYGVNEEGEEYLINVGTYPTEGAYVESVYLYDVCDYCGETR